MLIHVFSGGYNCDPRPCIESVMRQASGAFSVVHSVRVTHDDDRITMAQNIWEWIESEPEGDVAAWVDADDTLLDGALERICRAYQNPEVWVTHGSYWCVSGAPARFNGKYRSDNFRQLPWRAGHLKTCRMELLGHLKRHHFESANMEWYPMASDLALMFPLMEMAGLDRIKFLPHIIYNYNDENPLNDHKVDAGLQKWCEMDIRGNKNIFKRLNSL